MISDDALDFYEMLTIECPLLDMVEKRLSEKGDTTLRQELVRFQKDAALEIESVQYGGKNISQGHGRDLGKLLADHQPITPSSYSVFNRVADALKGHELEGAFSAIVAKIPKFETAPSSELKLTKEI